MESKKIVLNLFQPEQVSLSQSEKNGLERNSQWKKVTQKSRKMGEQAIAAIDRKEKT